MQTDEICAKIAAHPHLPSPPLVALQLLEMAGRPDCPMGDIAKLLRVDPVLCGALLRTVNSALFSLPRAVASVDRALALLGTKGVRSLVLGLSLTTLHRKSEPDPLLADFWKTSIAGAVIARELAVQQHRSDPEEDLLAGLLRDLGVLFLIQVYPQEYRQVLSQPVGVLAQTQCELETEAFGVNHAEVGAYVLAKWRLPREITEAIRYHHRPEQASQDARERAHLLDFASQISQLEVTPDLFGLRDELIQVAQARFGMDEEQFKKFLEPLQTKIEAFASILAVDIGQSENFADLLGGALEQLTQLISESNAEHLEVRAAKNQADQQIARLRKTAGRLRRETLRDPLTGAFNRSYFEESLIGEFKRARRYRTTLGLMFIDVDDFKHFNDQFGHPFGDQVLKEITATLQSETRDSDLVARYGGDEFSIILPHASEDCLQALGQRLLDALNQLVVRHGKNSARVSVSVGAVACIPHFTNRFYGQVLEAADNAMYQAKNRGKNQVFVATMLDQETDPAQPEAHAVAVGDGDQSETFA